MVDIGIPRPFLGAVRGKLDEDVKKSAQQQWMIHLTAAIRQLSISEEEQDRFVVDIKKYADTIDPEELGRIPRDKVLPYLLNCIWRAQVRSTKSESEYTEAKSSVKAGEYGSEEDSDGYETIGEDEEEGEGEEDGAMVSDAGLRSQEETKQKSKVTSFPNETVNTGDLVGGKKEQVKKYKLLLDHVAPFYLDKQPTMMMAAAAASMNTDPLDTLSRNEQRRFSRSLWRDAIDHMQPEYRLPTLILKKHQYVKREEPRNLGPGTYDPHYDGKKCRKNTLGRGQMYSCTPRFAKDYAKTDCPDPGAYGNPYDRYWRMLDRLKHPCRTPLMQSGPCDVRGGTFKTVGSSLGPGDYDPKSTTPSIIDKKKVSLRGPYDLFTPDRFDMVHGYYMKPKTKLEPGHYGIYDTMKQNLFNRYNHMKGRLSKLNRDQKCTGERITVVSPMWPTSESEEKPGPGAYDIDRVVNYHSTCWGENFWAFNSSVQAARGLGLAVERDYDNAPTRYRPELADLKCCPVGCGFQSNFKSKTDARLDPPKVAVLTERLRPKDIPPFEKVYKDDNDCQ